MTKPSDYTLMYKAHFLNLWFSVLVHKSYVLYTTLIFFFFLSKGWGKTDRRFFFEKNFLFENLGFAKKEAFARSLREIFNDRDYNDSRKSG